MILITSAYLSPRLQYISEILFQHILRTDYKLILPEEAAFYKSQYPDAVIISHGTKLKETHIFIPSEPLLYEEDLKELPPVSPEAVLSFSSNSEYNTDVLATAFRIITEYDLYRKKVLDEHDRYKTSGDISKPWLHVLAENIWQKATAFTPALKRERDNFNYKISFDIDSPWLYMHKPLHISGGGMAKDVLKRDWEALQARMSTITGKKKDPYDVYDYIFRQVEKDKLIFFFLVDRNHANDERYTYKNGPYRALIKSIQKAGVRIGIHPSYTSFLDEKRIAHETAQLKQITGNEITDARMHFLRYRLPETYRYLINAGIRHDYTTTGPEKTGFRHGMAIAFPWFDCDQNIKTSLWLHPTMMMDRTAQKYQQKSPSEALHEIMKIIDISVNYTGEFIILLHNNTLSEWKEWKGWRMVFEKTMRYLQQKTGGEKTPATREKTNRNE